MNESEFAVLMNALRVLEQHDSPVIRQSMLELVHNFDSQLNEHQKALILEELLHMENKRHHSFEKEDLREQINGFIRGYHHSRD